LERKGDSQILLARCPATVTNGEKENNKGLEFFTAPKIEASKLNPDHAAIVL